MSTFYVLASRQQVGRQFGELLGYLFPGVSQDVACWSDLAETLATLALARPDVYVVFREDLSDNLGIEDALITSSGAQPGDDIVEVTTGAALMEIRTTRWRLASTRLAA